MLFSMVGDFPTPFCDFTMDEVTRILAQFCVREHNLHLLFAQNLNACKRLSGRSRGAEAALESDLQVPLHKSSVRG